MHASSFLIALGALSSIAYASPQQSSALILTAPEPEATSFSNLLSSFTGSSQTSQPVPTSTPPFPFPMGNSTRPGSTGFGTGTGTRMPTSTLTLSSTVVVPVSSGSSSSSSSTSSAATSSTSATHKNAAGSVRAAGGLVGLGVAAAAFL